MNDCQRALMSYGLDLMARATQGDAPALRQQLGGSWPDHDWSPYEEVLIGERDLSPPQPGERLLSIFSRVRLPGAETEPPLAYYRPHLLQLNGETLFPDDKDARADPDREVTWDGFKKAVTGVMETGRKGEGLFETFYHLMYRHAWALPCTYGEEGVSLFEQWKAVAALAHASGQKWAEGPAANFNLVGGDIPGIQRFVYTITSKGAAKGLRGRSFFVQLLGDAVVRRILADLGLCSCNVVYNAGGNFTVLGPAGSEDALREWQGDVNRTLLDEFEGDLYLALAWESLPQSAAGTPEFATVCKRLGTKVAAAKSRCFAEVVERDGWAALFQPQGRGGLDYCQVCQREPRPGEKLVEETTETGETVMKCERCRSFEALARDIAYKKLWMVITEADAAARKGGGWQGTLAQLTGSAYRFVNDPSQVNRLGTVYVLNSTDLGEVSVHGFRFVANVTPRIEEADRRWVQEHHPDMEVPPGERIKDFALMALQSQGIPRVGVLRMDVDNLGTIFGQYLQGSMAQISALSAALDLFFGGYLNYICEGVHAQGEHGEVLYVIYAGGDDLFVVGAWDRMPILAERIRENFAVHTGRNPYLTLSGGVTLEVRKFPLYRAAERSGEAEGKAKEYTRPSKTSPKGYNQSSEEEAEEKAKRRKDAFCFLGQTVGWEEWPLVRETKEQLSGLIAAGVPRSLLRLAQILHIQFAAARRRALKAERKAGKKPTPGRIYWGRWAWMAAYSLTRLASGCPDKQKEEILRIQREGIASGAQIRFLGLAARWAEYQLRGGEK